MSNPNISRIHANYVHSLETLLPWVEQGPISTPKDEARFTETLAELVATHTDTIPILARGFLECRRYVPPKEVTRFLDEHLRARIGTRLVAEQHIALHFCSTGLADPEGPPYVRRDQAREQDEKKAAKRKKKGSSDDDLFDRRNLQKQHGHSGAASEHSSYIGVIDTALRPARIVDACAGFVADICELRYGVRPRWRIVDGAATSLSDNDEEAATTFAFVPMHLEYIVTELLKNAFRATVENSAAARNGSQGPLPEVEITIAPDEATTSLSQSVSGSSSSSSSSTAHMSTSNSTDIPPYPSSLPAEATTTATSTVATAAGQSSAAAAAAASGEADGRLVPHPSAAAAPGVTIRIRDRGGGISPEVLPNIWSYSFTTFNEDDDLPGGNGGGAGGDDALNAIAGSGAAGGGSSIAGLGYGLPLSRAYAEYFGGGIAVQSLYGWGTDVYLRLKGVGKID